ncbi:MAG: siderophore-interacting protein [Mesorhizobium sp.]|uniref:siderophore-interacting protein n=1 Tax=Mesorhizobium sp. TaxID=1871066 RepID=UPI001ACB83D4|nr:siderophore-interacting protein [Mesorhizobium sp.]MBN9218310.1 siderophore-interacting protein [Mesorhizobium sp.]
MRPARVAAVSAVSEHFRLVDLEGDALKNIAWTVGEKIQISMGTGLMARTYTPISWDTERGRTRLLAFMHGDAPGSRWAGGLREGDTCQFFGPRRSLDLSGIEAPLVLFGDETSFALAAALRTLQSPRTTVIFEVSDVAESGPVLEEIGLGDANLTARAANDAHLGAVADKVAAHASTGAHFVLTGKAPAIQHVNRALRAAGVGSSRMKTKAYWAPGKTGLD